MTDLTKAIANWNLLRIAAERAVAHQHAAEAEIVKMLDGPLAVELDGETVVLSKARGSDRLNVQAVERIGEVS